MLMTGDLGAPRHFAPKTVPHLPPPSPGTALRSTLHTVARDERMVGHPIAENPTVVTLAPGFISCKPHSNLEGHTRVLSLCR